VCINLFYIINNIGMLRRDVTSKVSTEETISENSFEYDTDSCENGEELKKFFQLLHSIQIKSQKAHE